MSVYCDLVYIIINNNIRLYRILYDMDFSLACKSSCMLIDVHLHADCKMESHMDYDCDYKLHKSQQNISRPYSRTAPLRAASG